MCSPWKAPSSTSLSYSSRRRGRRCSVGVDAMDDCGSSVACTEPHRSGAALSLALLGSSSSSAPPRCVCFSGTCQAGRPVGEPRDQHVDEQTRLRDERAACRKNGHGPRTRAGTRAAAENPPDSTTSANAASSANDCSDWYSTRTSAVSLLDHRENRWSVHGSARGSGARRPHRRCAVRTWRRAWLTAIERRKVLSEQRRSNDRAARGSATKTSCTRSSAADASPSRRRANARIVVWCCA